jgi:thiol-disulfide isomerase/thioredoxin
MAKKNGPLIFLIFLIVLLIAGFFLKNKLNRFLSEKMQQQAGAEIATSAEETIRKNYNYVLNRQDFEFTLLEFGAGECTACRQMAPVLDEISQWKMPKVNVVFLHVVKPENQDLMKFFGISAIPVQILLDRDGKEFFRHFGYIPAGELKTEFFRYGSTNGN